jgi:DNA mismatch repair protein MSH2
VSPWLEAKKDGTKFTNKKLRALSGKRVELDKTYESQQRHLVRRCRLTPSNPS